VSPVPRRLHGEYTAVTRRLHGEYTASTWRQVRVVRRPRDCDAVVSPVSTVSAVSVRRLIEKSEEVVDKELLIQHKEKLYVELKNILARQPGPEVAEQLSVYQQSLQERTKQMELMEAELSMSHTQARAAHVDPDDDSDEGGSPHDGAMPPPPDHSDSRCVEMRRDASRCVEMHAAPERRSLPSIVPSRSSPLAAPQASEYKYEIARITKELREVKKKFFEQKRREQHQNETRRLERATPAEVLVQEARASMNRFTGGGFNLNMPAS
jgi:hypothetical protein